jgi:hypothetical protein
MAGQHDDAHPSLSSGEAVPATQPRSQAVIKHGLLENPPLE